MTKDYYLFQDQLDHNVSAHPKSDRKTGEYMAFGYSLFDASVNYSLFDKDGILKNKIKVPLINRRMIHDFGVTENYAIIPDLAMEFKPE